MTQRRGRLDSEDLIPLLLGGFAGAVWMLLFTSGVAEADDCLRYVQKVKNFVAIPKDLLEDCMRTGSVQAIITMILGGMGGGLIATAVGKGLKDTNKQDQDAPGPDSPDDKDNPFDPTEDEKKKKWNEEKVVWDPRELGWRRPRPEEYPPADEGPERKGPSKEEIKNKWEKEGLVWDPEKNIWRKKGMDESPPPDYPPEESPYAKGNPRANTPPECLDKYDAYVRSQKRMLELEPEIEKTALDFRLAQDWLQLKLGIFTAQFAVDMTDFMQFGTAMVRAAGPISQAIGKAGSISSAMKAAGRRAASIAKTVMQLLAELAELGVKAAKLRTAAGVLKESARILTKYADDLAEAVLALDRRVASNRSLLAAAENLEPLQSKRATIVSNLIDAQKRLEAADKLWQRKYQLQRWAESERVSITADQARLAVAVQQELDAVNAELVSLRAKIAQSPEVANAAQRTSKATTSLNAIQTRINELEAFARDLVTKIEPIKARVNAARAKLDQAKQLDAEIGEIGTLRRNLDEKIAEVAAADARLAEFEASPAATKYDSELAAIKQKGQASLDDLQQARLKDDLAEKAQLDLKKEIEAEIRSRGVDPDTADTGDPLDVIPPERVAELRDKGIKLDAERVVTKAELKEKAAIRQQVRQEVRAAEAELEAANADFVRQRAELQLDVDIARDAQQGAETAYQAKTKSVDTRFESSDIERTANEASRLRAEAEEVLGPGNQLDLDYLQAAEEELVKVRGDLKSKRAEHAEAKTEFDEAYNAEQDVTRKVEQSAREALEARKADAEARLKSANRTWQEVAAEKSPGDFQEWKLTVEGSDPFNDGPNELRPLQQEVLDGRKAEAEIEKEIGAQRDKAEDLKKSIADDERVMNEKRPEADAAREKSNTGEAEAKTADREASDAEAQYAAKDAEVRNAKADLASAEADAAKEAINPGDIDPSIDPMGKGVSGAIDDLTKWSAEASKAVKPGWARGTEEVMRTIAGAFGERWTKLFNGQSPDEVAEGLKKSRDKVIRLKDELESKKAEYDALRIAIHTQKPALDACVQQHTYWKGPTAGE